MIYSDTLYRNTLILFKILNLKIEVISGLPFAQLLRNFCGTKRKIFLFLRISFARKKQQFAQSFAKVILRKIALFRFCETQVLRNSAISYQNPKQIV